MNATHRTPLLLVFTITLLILSGRTSATEYTIDPVFFESSMPSKSTTLSQALSDTEGSEKVLAMDLAVINKLPASYKIQVVAQTDSSECINKECLELSLRRAALVNQWLLEHGVPSTRLLTPIGLGNEQPISSNSTAIGRGRNRYALPRVVFRDDELGH
ncbi:OmpA family protein [Bacillus sp. NP157]|nr:OmpA family protein [Bacillus sp. NP157]